MEIGIPKEIMVGERRVALTPDAVGRLRDAGHRVFVEKGAGVRCGFSDPLYRKSGAAIVPSKKSLYEKARLIVKVKEPEGEDLARLAPHHILFSYLHLAAHPRLVKTLLTRQVTTIGFESVEEDDGSYPCLVPMSEIAGRVAVQLGAFHLGTDCGGAGLLMGGAAGVDPAHVLILGAGRVGKNAAQVARGMGGTVSIYDRNADKAERLAQEISGKVVAVGEAALGPAVASADLVIGAVLVPGRKAPVVVTRAMVRTMRPLSVIVDVAIDQGGCVATSRPMTLARPTFKAFGVIHCCIPNLPSIVARTATLALSQAILPRVVTLAAGGIEGLERNDPALFRAINLAGGQKIHPTLR